MALLTKFPQPSDFGDWMSYASALHDVLAKHLGSIPDVPVGHVILYGGSLPQGYLNCDGTNFSKTTYPALSNRLGSNTTPVLSAPPGFKYAIRAR